MNIKDIKETREEINKISSRGFGYFVKNILVVILILLCTFIIANPTIITNTKEYFENFNSSSLWVLVVLFFSIVGIYQLVNSINNDNKEERVKEISEAEEKKKEEDRIEHKRLVKQRFEIGPHISNELKNLLINLDADRAAILEMHNGTNNLTGLPFIYGDMVYEEISPNVDFISDEFKNINLSKFSFAGLHYDEGTWIGSRDEIEAEDPYLGAKLRLANVKYGAILVLQGFNGPIGFLTLFFADEKKHPTKAKIIAELNQSAQVLSTLLDKRNLITE